MKYLAVDNGKSGALALLNTETEEVRIEDVRLDPFRELDCDWLLGLLLQWSPLGEEIDKGIIEFCHNNNGLVEMGGKFIAVAEIAGIRIEKVAVNRWKKAILGESTNNKNLSVDTCLQLYPNANINRPSPKGRKISPNHDRAEAVLLCHYLRTINP